MPRSTKAVKRYHHGNLRDSAIGAATRIVETQGLGALTLRKVATAVGARAPSMYHHFRSKEDLIAAAAGRAFEDLDRQLGHAQGATAAERLEQMGAIYIRFALKQTGAFRLLFGAHVRDLGLSSYDCVRVPGRRTRTRLKTAITAAFSEADLSLDPEDAFALLWGQLVGIAALFAEREIAADQDLEEAQRLARLAVRSHLRRA